MNRSVNRRRFLAGLAVAGGSALIRPAGFAAAQPTQAGSWNAPVSRNGWPVVPPGAVRRRRIEGSMADVELLDGDATDLLVHVARRFHYEVRPLTPGDVTGYRADRGGVTPLESDYLSGTAIALHPQHYPLGVSGGFLPAEVAVIRDILAECGGAVRWGGDDPRTPKESHFALDSPPRDPVVGRAAGMVRAWRTAPGQGAGTSPDPFDAARRGRACALESRQRHSR
ncbi:twin-arginine translocation signal domain-containing protein [Amycolatopsis nalaikhensis]|jgi:hypothetical protein|uniref:Twin-arginine translocation signal domain-containing protein n=1 Tax=Amycolatopsis nalaikhensis TaxID=715472 RepID=A0ABY8XQN6_9PSEU|nr:twin-arginine translocation signal domain-containing protein [Amycolatopsis sp. 2-2]WIV57980.1 twin-arginine translocation signal domain-containing protein [Amycolatopsis sp. 2-2]